MDVVEYKVYSACYLVCFIFERLARPLGRLSVTVLGGTCLSGISDILRLLA